MPRLGDVKRLSQNLPRNDVLPVRRWRSEPQVRFASVAPCRLRRRRPRLFPAVLRWDEQGRGQAALQFRHARRSQSTAPARTLPQPQGRRQSGTCSEPGSRRREISEGASKRDDHGHDSRAQHKLEMTLAGRYLGVDDVDDQRREQGACRCRHDSASVPSRPLRAAA